MGAGVPEPCAIKSYSVVVHGERDEIVFADQLDFDLRRAGVAGDVAQTLLHDAIQTDRQFCGERGSGVSMDV